MSERDESTHPTAGSTLPPTTPKGSSPGARLARNMVFYTIVRLLLVLALTLVIIGLGTLAGVQIPVLVAAILAVVIALPLSMVLFSRLRAQINSDIAEVDAGRREKRDDLRRRMNEA
ncbi:DUF4229 domain-containing protein [Dietzia cinnamea]|uniref:DUF4229 domain-containing protein n=1 Tax=Dietzia cinnamea TaxID=321318 RepID=UPI0021A47D61|nr:DUF4229 domain-containing protein [Dietzia cinnamea]MCT1712800.1 DUF4229 domain-containing protein [Dietzia cinnamea]